MKQIAKTLFFPMMLMTDVLSHFFKQKWLVRLIMYLILFTIWGLFLFDVIEWSPYLEGFITTYLYVGVVISLMMSNENPV